MARKLAVEKEVDDMTECPICNELFTDPRVLPCIHTFCLKCLENYGKDRPPGDDMPCPLCRKEFTIPDDGLSGIQKDFFMEPLKLRPYGAIQICLLLLLLLLLEAASCKKALSRRRSRPHSL